MAGSGPEPVGASAKERPLRVTRERAWYVASTRIEAIPAGVRREARRALLNYVGCAIGGAGDAAVAEVTLESGERVSASVHRAVGNLARPPSDRALEKKFRDQASLSLAPGQVEELIGLCRRIDELDRVGRIGEAATPGASSPPRGPRAPGTET